MENNLKNLYVYIIESLFVHPKLTHPKCLFCTSLVAQLVKNPLAMQETWVLSLGWEDALEEGKAAHSSILA